MQTSPGQEVGASVAADVGRPVAAKQRQENNELYSPSSSGGRGLGEGAHSFVSVQPKNEQLASSPLIPLLERETAADAVRWQATHLPCFMRMKNVHLACLAFSLFFTGACFSVPIG